jgi:ABC-type amino acid transport substrate-binding protein
MNFVATARKLNMGRKLMSKSQIVIRSILSCGAIAFLLLAAPIASAQTTLQNIRSTGVMTLGNTFNYPPFCFIANGEKVGFNVDIVTEIAKRMKVNLKLETIEFRGVIGALKSGRIDVYTGMVYTPDRAKQMAFSIPYYDDGIAAAYPEGKPVSKPADLAGKQVGVELGSAGDKFVRDELGSSVKVKTFDTSFLGLKDLSSGRLDAFIGNVAPMRYIMLNMPSLKLSPTWTSMAGSINTRLEDEDLLAEINKQLSAMKEDGSYRTLAAKWFGP